MSRVRIVPVAKASRHGALNDDASAVMFHCRITYWMAGLSHDPEDFFRYLAIAFSADLVMSAVMRSSVFVTSSPVISEVWAASAVVTSSAQFVDDI